MAYRAGTTFTVNMPAFSKDWVSGIEFRVNVTEEIDVAANTSRFNYALQYKGNITRLNKQCYFKFNPHYSDAETKTFSFTGTNYSDTSTWTTIPITGITLPTAGFSHDASGAGSYSQRFWIDANWQVVINFSDSSAISVQRTYTAIDRTPPTLTVAVSNLGKTGATITATASHSSYNISQIAIIVDGVDYFNSTPANPKTYAKTLTGLTSGSTYTYTAIATAENGLQYYRYGSFTTYKSVTSVNLSPSSVDLIAGTTRQLTATVYPTSGVDNSVSYTSSNTAVATVSASGLVTAVSAGTATITVTTVDGNKTATCSVSVTAAAIPVSSVSISPSTVSMAVGGKQQLTTVFNPSNATNKAVTWTSSNTNIARVDEGGLVTAVAVGGAIGNATITVTTVDGGKTATRTVTTSATYPTMSTVSRLTETVLSNVYNACIVLKASLADKSISVTLISPLLNLDGRTTDPRLISDICTISEANCRAIRTALATVTDFEANALYGWTGQNTTWYAGVNNWIAFCNELRAMTQGTAPLKAYLNDKNNVQINVRDSGGNSVPLFVCKNISKWSDL